MATVLLYPGAGSDSNHASLRAIEQAVAPHRCVRADFPYRLQGRKAPDRAPVLMAAVREQIAALSDHEPLVIGGRSMGGRMCSMIAAGVDGAPPPEQLRGLVLICYPLHPPGKPESLRVEHLPAVAVPTLFVSGTRDAFGTPDELTRWTATMSPKASPRHVWLEGKGHDLKGADSTIAATVAEFVAEVCASDQGFIAHDRSRRAGPRG
jgi:predicted alpha/beta-hydrolase family hydrolase